MGLLSRPLELLCPHRTGCSLAAGSGLWPRVGACSGRWLGGWKHGSLELPASQGGHPCWGRALQGTPALLPSEGFLVSGAGEDKCHRVFLVPFSSSSCEFGAAFESAEDDEGEEEGSASQAAVPAAATEEAVRHYIRSRPALYRKVLLYQPFELAELQAELKQHGIRVATQKLLDFLDAHCITFTTAAARKEKLRRKRRQPVGKKRGRAARPVRPSASQAVSGL